MKISHNFKIASQKFNLKIVNVRNVWCFRNDPLYQMLKDVNNVKPYNEKLTNSEEVYKH